MKDDAAPYSVYPAVPEGQAPVTGQTLYQGPSLYPLTGQDFLLVTTAGSVAGVTLTITVRTLNQKGQVQRHAPKVVPSSNRTIGTAFFNIGDGFLLDVTVRVTAGTVLYGQVWCVVDLVIGQTGEQQKLVTLAAGYPTANAPLWGPASEYMNSLDGQGAVRVITVTQPAAGADWTQSVPTGARWQFISAQANLQTAVAAANRQVRVLFDDGANAYYLVPAIVTEAASLSFFYGWGGGAGGPIVTPDPAFFAAPTPNDFAMLAGHRVRSSTVAIQAADQWFNIFLNVREWLEV